MAKSNHNKMPTPKACRDALLAIAKMGLGLKPEIIDWPNVGKNAVKLARDTVAGKCQCCGKQQEFIS